MAMQDDAQALEDVLSLQQFVTYRLARVQAKLNAQASRILKDAAGLSLTQWRIIFLLGTMGTSKSSDLTWISGIDKGLFSRKLKTLIASGLVQAETDQSDQRVQRLSLTDHGRDVFTATLPRMRARQTALQRNINEADLETFHRVLGQVEQAAEENDPSS